MKHVLVFFLLFLTGCATGLVVESQTQRSITIAVHFGSTFQEAADFADKYCQQFQLRAQETLRTQPYGKGSAQRLTFHCVE